MATARPLTYGELLRRYRLAAGMTQEALAARAGLSPQGIGALERGDRRTPRKATLTLLADALALSPVEQQRFMDMARRGTVPTFTPNGQNAEHTPTANPLIGRTTEIEQLLSHLSTDGPPLMLIAGEPGIGKTRLLQETAAHASAAGWTVLQGKCYQHNGHEPYAPFGNMLAQFLVGRTPAQQRIDLQGCAWLVHLLPEIAEYTAPIPTRDMTISQERRLLFSAVARLLTNVADPIGTLVIIDDAQWAGVDTLNLLVTLVRSRTETSWPPLRYLVAYRDTDIVLQSNLNAVRTELAREQLATCLALSPLEEMAAGTLLDGIVEIDAATRQHVLQQASGVPFFLVEWAQTLASGDFTTIVPGHELPSNITASLQQRWSMLSPAAQDVLGIVAIAGRHLPRRLLFLAIGMLTTLSEAAIAIAVDAAASARLIEQNDDGSYTCTHDVIRETLINDMSLARRLALHHAVAEALERSPRHERHTAELAEHFAQADLPERAFPYALRAGERAEALYAQAETEQYYQMAVVLAREVVDQSREAEAVEHLGVFYSAIGRQQDAIAMLNQAISLYRKLGQRDHLARATTLLARGYNRAGQTEAGARHLAALLIFLTPNEPPFPGELSLQEIIEVIASPRAKRALENLASWSAAALSVSLAVHLGDLGSPQQALGITEHALTVAKMEGDVSWMTIANLHLGLRLVELGRLREARQVFLEATRLSHDSGERGAMWITSYALAYTANCTMMQGDMQSAESMWIQSLQWATQMGYSDAMAISTAGLSDLAFLTGDWTLARRQADAACNILRPLERSRVTQWTLVKLGRLGVITGEQTQGIALLNDVLARDGGTAQRQAHLIAQQTLAEVDLIEGRGATARVRLAPFIDYSDQIDVQLAWLLPWCELVEGNTEQALAQILAATAHAQAEQMRVLLTDTLRVQALCFMRQEQWQNAIATLNEALIYAREIPVPYAEAKALYALGQVQMAQGARQQARDTLHVAQTICATLGENLYLPKIQHTLAMLSG